MLIVLKICLKLHKFIKTRGSDNFLLFILNETFVASSVFMDLLFNYTGASFVV